MADEALSVEAAVGLLDAQDAPADTQEAAAADADVADEQDQADATADDGADPDEGAADAEDGDQAEPEVPAIDPPDWWNAEAKARFADLPADLQQVVLDQEKTRVSATGKAMQEAAEVRKKADAEYQNFSQVTQALGQWLPQAVETFKSRWEDIDWRAWAEADPEACMKGKIQFDAEREELQRVQTAKQQADQLARSRHNEAEAERLKVVAPALADPKEGPKRKQELASYLRTLGATEEQLSSLTADIAGIGYKAMLYDRAQAGLKATPPKIAPKATKPSAAPQADSPNREAVRLKNRFSQTGSVDDAVALLLARG